MERWGAEAATLDEVKKTEGQRDTASARAMEAARPLVCLSAESGNISSG